MEIRVDNKVIVVTGGTQGVGQAVAVEAARSGATGLVVTGRNGQRGEETLKLLGEMGATAIFVPGDLQDPLTPANIFRRALEHFEKVDALVNAAAISDRGSIATADAAFFDRMFAVNTRAPMLMMQELIRHLVLRKAHGAIVNVLSVNAHGGSPPLGVYADSKAATALLTKNAAFSHRHDRVRVNGINLGWTNSPGEREMQANKLGQGEEWLRRAEAHMPWGRLILPEDVARLALFLLSDSSIPMTGALIDQDQNFVLGTKE